jgi:hypothetical protein
MLHTGKKGLCSFSTNYKSSSFVELHDYLLLFNWYTEYIITIRKINNDRDSRNEYKSYSIEKLYKQIYVQTLQTYNGVKVLRD